MKAILCQTYGPPETLAYTEIPTPPLTDKGVRIGIHAAGVNFPDLLIIEGRYQIKPNLPFSPGAGVSGEVLETGSAVTGFSRGDRVIGMTRWNGYAEEVVIPVERCLLMPENMDPIVAAGLPMTYGTAYHALVQRAALRSTDTLVVHGAAGGIGTAAIDIGQCLGARIIATGGNDDKLQAVGQHYKVAHLVNYVSDPDWKDRVKTLTNGQGADIIFDPVGGDVFEQSLRCINWEGRLLVVGFTSGTIPKARANLILLKGCSVVGVFWGDFVNRDPTANRANFEQLFTWYEAGYLRPLIDRTFPLEQAATALQVVARREVVGKIVLTTSQYRGHLG